MVLETLANGILGLVNWGITIIVAMFLWEFYRLVTFNSPGAKFVEGGGVKGNAKAMAEGVKKLWRGEQKQEKFELKKYVSLEKLEKDVTVAQNDAELKKTVGSDERTAKRDESRAYRRLERLEKDLKKAGLKPEVQAKVDLIVKEVEVFNNLVLEHMKKFDVVLEKNYTDFNTKKEALIREIKQAVAAERALVAEMQKLNALFK